MGAVCIILYTMKTSHKYAIAGLFLVLLGIFLVYFLRPVTPLVTIPSVATNLPAITPPPSSTPVLLGTKVLQATNTDRTKIESDIIKTKTLAVISYGSGEGQLGVRNGDGGTVAYGPDSFTLDVHGNILIADRFNNRVSIFSKAGVYVHSVSLNDVTIDDIATDPSGNIYIFDYGRRILHQYNTDGVALGAVEYDSSKTPTRGYLHTEGNFVYFADASSADTLLAIITEGTIKPPPATMDRDSDGIHTASGNIYMLDMDSNKSFDIFIHDDSGIKKEQIYSIPLTGVLSVSVVGEDQSGKLYILAEIMEQGEIVSKIMVFDSNMALVDTKIMPSMKSDLWTDREILLGTDGALTAFSPQSEHALIRSIR